MSGDGSFLKMCRRTTWKYEEGIGECNQLCCDFITEEAKREELVRIIEYLKVRFVCYDGNDHRSRVTFKLPENWEQALKAEK